MAKQIIYLLFIKRLGERIDLWVVTLDENGNELRNVLVKATHKEEGWSKTSYARYGIASFDLPMGSYIIEARKFGYEKVMVELDGSQLKDLEEGEVVMMGCKNCEKIMTDGNGNSNSNDNNNSNGIRPWKYTDDIIAISIVIGYLLGKYFGFEVPEWMVIAALLYAFGAGVVDRARNSK